MKITTRTGQTSTVIEVYGAINVYSASVLGQALQSLIAEGVRTIVLDLSSVEAIDSSGLGTLVGNAKAMASCGGVIALAGVNGRVMKVLTITNLDKYFSICKDASEVVGQTSCKEAD